MLCFPFSLYFYGFYLLWEVITLGWRDSGSARDPHQLMTSYFYTNFTTAAALTKCTTGVGRGKQAQKTSFNDLLLICFKWLLFLLYEKTLGFKKLLRHLFPMYRIWVMGGGSWCKNTISKFFISCQYMLAITSAFLKLARNRIWKARFLHLFINRIDLSQYLIPDSHGSKMN